MSKGNFSVAINGFGRIGRSFLRAVASHPPTEGEIRVVAINDLTDPQTLAHLLKYDSVHGPFQGTVASTPGAIIVNGNEIPVFQEKEPVNLPWGRLSVDVVVESSGHFTNRAAASQHLKAGAKNVVISAPAQDPDITLVLGVNQAGYLPGQHRIVSSASCTTYCLAPVAKVLLQHFGIKHGLMTTVHSYTNDQALLDLPHQDLRRARAGALSMIPTTTGAARALFSVLPELRGKLDGMAVRVPTPNVSLIDLVVEMESDVTVEAVSAAMKKAAQEGLAGILAYSEEPLVSIDFTGNPHSCIVDGSFTKVIRNRMVKVIAWYDNEWSYACRIRDLIGYLSKYAHA